MSYKYVKTSMLRCITENIIFRPQFLPMNSINSLKRNVLAPLIHAGRTQQMGVRAALSSFGANLVHTEEIVDQRPLASKKVKNDVQSISKRSISHSVDNSDSSNKSAKSIATEAAEEMEQYFNALNAALEKHLSMKVNLKVYEDLSVTLENGETHRLIKFARISLKTPNGPIVLNFSDNPAAIKPAKIAIQNMAENVSPQVDGIIIYVPIPKPTRERREELATNSAKLILNEYKLALNEVYKKYTKLLGRSSNNKEMVVRLTNGLLALKKLLDKQGEDKVKERSQMLLKEIHF